ncbi:MAG: enoyl-CoA hydratase/isomerase family protein [Actinobacteria bacterium]|nr:enoyl-CoA hydratase/isomerase family protein [Actinomycetota bacterium]
MPPVLYEKSGSTGWIRFNRPEVRNALNLETTNALRDALIEANGDADLNAIVISSVSDDFSSGADLREMVKEFEDLEARTLTINGIIETTTNGLQQVARLMRQTDKIVVASVGGYALGAGFEVVLDSDLIVASEDATFGFPEARAGMSVTGGVTKLLAQSIGANRARELFLTGRFIKADEAFQMGMVNRLVAGGTHDEEAEKLVAEITKNSPLSVIAHKRMLQQSLDADLETVFNLEKQTIGVLCTTSDAVEACSAFLEKRDPVFQGR